MAFDSRLIWIGIGTAAVCCIILVATLWFRPSNVANGYNADLRADATFVLEFLESSHDAELDPELKPLRAAAEALLDACEHESQPLGDDVAVELKNLYLDTLERRTQLQDETRHALSDEAILSELVDMATNRIAVSKNSRELARRAYENQIRAELNDHKSPQIAKLRSEATALEATLLKHRQIGPLTTLGR